MNQLKIYKPKKTNDGAASQLQLKLGEPDKYGVIKADLFWEIAPQKGATDSDGNATFDWEKKIIMKLGIPDISEILLVLRGVKKIAGQQEGKYQGLFHQNGNGNTVLQLGYLKMEKFEGYNLRISSQRGEAKNEVKHSLTLAEGEVLRVLLERAVIRFYGW